MKLKAICVMLVLACGTLLASPRKLPCPEAQAAARVEKAHTEATALADDADFLPIHRFSSTVL
jgi:hypothetical protein